MSTFIGDSTYTRAPPTYRSPLRSNYLQMNTSPTNQEQDGDNGYKSTLSTLSTRP
jgi:hypothetical protein